jgi:DNA-binding Lrp family transcriptional regulator
VEEEIIRLLKERGPLPVYQLAKELRATYGAVQYYIERLMKRGKIYTVKVGARRYVALNGQDWLKAVRVEDVLEELNAALRRAKINPKENLHEALKTLGHTSPHVAEALMLIIQASTQQRQPAD